MDAERNRAQPSMSIGWKHHTASGGALGTGRALRGQERNAEEIISENCIPKWKERWKHMQGKQKIGRSCGQMR